MSDTCCTHKQIQTHMRACAHACGTQQTTYILVAPWLANSAGISCHTQTSHVLLFAPLSNRSAYYLSLFPLVRFVPFRCVLVLLTSIFAEKCRIFNNMKRKNGNNQKFCNKNSKWITKRCAENCLLLFFCIF